MPKENKTLSDPTLTKLLEAEAELTTQEAGLQAQLQQIQQKRQSLQTVIGMFTPKKQAGADEIASAEPASDSTTAQLQQVDTSKLHVATNADEQKEDPAPRKQRSSSTKQPRTSIKQSQSKKKAPGAAAAGERESWRPYVREEFPDKASLPEVVSTVLQRLPERVFGVPELMNAIFKEELPAKDYQKAHRRLLSLLSKGVKDNQWVRHDKGHYSAAVQPQTKSGVA